MLTVNSSRKLSRRRSCRSRGLFDPAHCRARSPGCRRLIEVLPRLPCRAALPFAGLPAASGALPACKPAYAVAGWRNGRAPGLTDYLFKNDHDKGRKRADDAGRAIERPTQDLDTSRLSRIWIMAEKAAKFRRGAGNRHHHCRKTPTPTGYCAPDSRDRTL